MSTKKQIGMGMIVEMDPAGGTSYSAITMAINCTPPGREREIADGGVLGENFHVPVQGREAASEVTIAQFWEPGDTDHELIDTAFDGSGGSGSQSIGDVVSFRFVYPHDGTASGSVAPTDAFSGFIKNIGPQSIEVTGTIRREVTIQRTTDITRATTNIA